MIHPVLGPITAKAKLQLTMKPGVDMKIPQALAHIMLDQITIALQKQQVWTRQFHVPQCGTGMSSMCLYVGLVRVPCASVWDWYVIYCGTGMSSIWYTFVVK